MDNLHDNAKVFSITSAVNLLLRSMLFCIVVVLLLNCLSGIADLGYQLLFIVFRLIGMIFSGVILENRMIPKLNYNAFREAALSIGEGEKLPEQLPENLEDEELKNELHRLLVCVEIVEGELKCPESGRVFPIRDGIPNMLTNADEIK
ncbi:tRNA methyltransferase 11-2-like protein [Dirofilaria immitis]|nr:tRNA methyltransferase 11-2-like protein [Dirofilaria immitis]